MNTFALVSTIMTPHTALVTVNPDENLAQVKEIFDTHKFHHIPVVHFRDIVGIISKTDFMYFLGGASLYDDDRFENESRLKRAKAKDIMTTGLAKLEPDDRINVALEV
ncbi:MAG: CBS domain-containing protein, partial [Saprospiraceae bacterium]|nr:CBS domain-containing protein [Saprospiraceae bacterium]